MKENKEQHHILMEILKEVKFIQDLVIQHFEKTSLPEQTKLFSVPRAAHYLGVSIHTIYKYSSRGTISCTKPNGKEIMFRQQDLDDFLDRNHRKSPQEIISDVDELLTRGHKNRPYIFLLKSFVEPLPYRFVVGSGQCSACPFSRYGWVSACHYVHPAVITYSTVCGLRSAVHK